MKINYKDGKLSFVYTHFDSSGNPTNRQIKSPAQFLAITRGEGLSHLDIGYSDKINDYHGDMSRLLSDFNTSDKPNEYQIGRFVSFGNFVPHPDTLQSICSETVTFFLTAIQNFQLEIIHKDPSIP